MHHRGNMCLPKVLKPVPIKMDVPAKRVPRELAAFSFLPPPPSGPLKDECSIPPEKCIRSFAHTRAHVRPHCVPAVFAWNPIRFVRIHVYFSLRKSMRNGYSSRMFQTFSTMLEYRARRKRLARNEFSKKRLKANVNYPS